MNIKNKAGLSELACKLLNMPNGFFSKEDIELRLMERFSVDFTQFATLVEALLPFAANWESNITGEHFCGFVVDGEILLQEHYK